MYAGNSVYVDNRILFINNVVDGSTDGNPIFNDWQIPLVM